MSQENVEIVGRIYQAFATGGVEAALPYLAPNGVLYPFPEWPGPSDYRGRDAFRISFDRLTNLLQEVGSGKRGNAPASIVILGGDVHHAYLAEVAFPRSAAVSSAVYQAVCSPMRNPLGNSEKRAIRIAASRLGHAVGRGLARLAGVPEPRLRWRFVEGPLFNNQIATLKLRRKEAALRLDKTVSASDEFAFQRVFEHPLAG